MLRRIVFIAAAAAFVPTRAAGGLLNEHRTDGDIFAAAAGAGSRYRWKLRST